MTSRTRVTRVLLGTGLTGILLAGAFGPAASRAASIAGQKNGLGSPIPVRTQEFTVVSVRGATPNTFIVQRSLTGPEIAVTLSPTARVVRRFDGKSDLSEFSCGDHVLITPVVPPVATTATSASAVTPALSITAAAVKNKSIQVAYTQINGRVLFVSQALTQLELVVTANEGKLAAIPVGDRAFVDVAPTTLVNLIGKPAATIADVRPNMILTMWGLSNNVAHVVFAPHDITQLLSSPAMLTKAAPDDNSPK